MEPWQAVPVPVFLYVADVDDYPPILVNIGTVVKNFHVFKWNFDSFGLELLDFLCS